MKHLLQKMTSEAALEARWLNTLSLLEHMGARKIAKTVAQTHSSLEILEHYADETRHAAVFKRLSAEVFPETEESYLCKDHAIRYFQDLDHQLASWIAEKLSPSNHYPNYLLTTSLIERRAMQIYPLYREVTTQNVVRRALDRIIREEASHRRDIDNEIRHILREKGYDLSDCWPIEARLFKDFLDELEFHLSEPGSQVSSCLPTPAPEISVE